MKCIAVQSHRSKYPNPIEFDAGEQLTVGRTDDEYPGWIWTETSDGNAGWAPESVLGVQTDETATSLAAYSARELETELDDEFDVVRELAGWYWVRNQRGDEGWIPIKTTREA